MVIFYFQNIKKNSNAIKSISRSGVTFTATKCDNTTFTFTQQDNNTTYANYKGATTAASGTAGLVPAATTANRLKFLRGDGSWQTPTDTNTWRGIQNNLTSTSTTDSLSAAMGKALKDQIKDLGAIVFQDPFSRYDLGNGVYIIYGARIYSGININTLYTSGGQTAYFYNFSCSLGSLVPTRILAIVATAHCNGGLYAVSTATTSKTNITGFIWAPVIETNKSVSLNLIIVCN